MKTVYKYPILITDFQEVCMPQGAHLLSVQMQNGQPCLWALVDKPGLTEQCRMERRQIIIVGTGMPAPPLGRHISTFQMNGGSLVWHVFEAAE